MYFNSTLYIIHQIVFLSFKPNNEDMKFYGFKPFEKVRSFKNVLIFKVYPCTTHDNSGSQAVEHAGEASWKKRVVYFVFVFVKAIKKTRVCRF